MMNQDARDTPPQPSKTAEYAIEQARRQFGEPLTKPTAEDQCKQIEDALRDAPVSESGTRDNDNGRRSLDEQAPVTTGSGRAPQGEYANPMQVSNPAAALPSSAPPSAEPLRSEPSELVKRIRAYSYADASAVERILEDARYFEGVYTELQKKHCERLEELQAFHAARSATPLTFGDLAALIAEGDECAVTDCEEQFEYAHGLIQRLIAALRSKSSPSAVWQCPTCGGDGKLTDKPGTFKPCHVCCGYGRIMPCVDPVRSTDSTATLE